MSTTLFVVAWLVLIVAVVLVWMQTHRPSKRTGPTPPSGTPWTSPTSVPTVPPIAGATLDNLRGVVDLVRGELMVLFDAVGFPEGTTFDVAWYLMQAGIPNGTVSDVVSGHILTGLAFLDPQPSGGLLLTASCDGAVVGQVQVTGAFEIGGGW